MSERGDLIHCPTCGQDYRQGQHHECIPLHEEMGIKLESTPTRALPRGSMYATASGLDSRMVGPDGMPGTGLTRREIIGRASVWWDHKGRHLIRRQFVTSSAMCDRIISGLLEGRAWELLTGEEAVRVCETWYFNVWIPQEKAEKNTADLKHIKTGIG